MSLMAAGSELINLEVLRGQGSVTVQEGIGSTLSAVCLRDLLPSVHFPYFRLHKRTNKASLVQKISFLSNLSHFIDNNGISNNTFASIGKSLISKAA